MSVTTRDGDPVGVSLDAPPGGPGSGAGGNLRNRGPGDPGVGGGFPDGVLEAIETAFSWLCTRPHPVTVDGRAVAGLPAARVPLDELRARLLDPVTAPEVRARVWAHLIWRARIDGPTWTVACAGMALPMLAGVARELTAQLAGDPADIRSEIVAGFLDALATADLTRTPLASLRWAAWRAGHRALQATLDADRPVDPHTLTATGHHNRTGLSDGGADLAGWDSDESPAPGEGGVVERRPRGFESAPPPAQPGHPDLVLARAVTDGVLSVSDAALIGTTRLEAVSLVEAADALQAPLPTVTSWRRRAEGRLLTHLTHTSPDTSPGTSPEPGSGRRGSDGGQQDESGRSRAAASSGRRRRRTRRAPGHRGSGTADTAIRPGSAAGRPVTAGLGGAAPVEVTR